MRALLSWDVDGRDPEYDQIVIALGGCLPADRIRPLTNTSVLIDPLNATQFNELYLRIEALADAYGGRLFFVLSLHEKRAPVWGVFRGVSSAFVVE